MQANAPKATKTPKLTLAECGCRDNLWTVVDTAERTYCLSRNGLETLWLTRGDLNAVDPRLAVVLDTQTGEAPNVVADVMRLTIRLWKNLLLPLTVPDTNGVPMLIDRVNFAMPSHTGQGVMFNCSTVTLSEKEGISYVVKHSQSNNYFLPIEQIEADMPGSTARLKSYVALNIGDDNLADFLFHNPSASAVALPVQLAAEPGGAL
jgi:hypothetical protein